MLIAGCIIQKKKINDYTDNLFDASYKGKQIYVSTNHGFGSPQEKHLKRFLVSVIDIKTDTYDVVSYKDCHTIRDAIIYALREALIIP